jgi:hypothetical protein
MGPQVLHGLPVLASAAFLHWALSSDGRLTGLYGSTEHMKHDPVDILGKDVRESLKCCPGLLAVFLGVLAGRQVHEVVTVGKRLWEIFGLPHFGDGKVIGASGTSFLLTNAESGASARQRTWKVRGLPTGYRGPAHNGDVIVRCDDAPGAALVRDLSEADLCAMFIEIGRHTVLTSDSGAPCQLLPPSRSVRLLP